MIQIHKSLTFVGDCASQLLLASPAKSMGITVVVSVVLGMQELGKRFADFHGE